MKMWWWFVQPWRTIMKSHTPSIFTEICATSSRKNQISSKAMPQVWSWFLNACEHFGTGGSDKHGCNRQSWWCSNKWWGIREHCSLIFRWWDWKDERILLSFYEGKPRPFSSQRWDSIVNTFVTFEAWPFFTGLAKPWASAIFTTGGGDSSGRFWRKLWKRVRVDLTFLDPGQPPGRQRSLGKRCLDGDQTTFGIVLRAFFFKSCQKNRVGILCSKTVA